MTKPSNTKANPMAAAMNNLTALNPMQGGPMKAMLAVGTQTMQFLSSRMQQDIETQRVMLSCKTFGELQKVQADFYANALEEYRGATAKVMEIMTAGASNAAAVPSAKRGYDDVPL